MKSIVKKKPEAGLWLENSPLPNIKNNEVLIKIHKTSICGTDLNIYQWNQWAKKNVPVPLIVGHEFVGTIADRGKDVQGFEIGTRVSGEGHLTCGSCSNCRKGKKHICLNVRGLGYHTTGCFAEYMALPAENVFILPDFVSDEVAAIFDPFGNAVHTALQYNLIGEDILITGAGPLGLMAVAIAKKGGARKVVITDINEYRLSLATQLGATCAIDITKKSISEALRSVGIHSGFTVGMEMSGNPKALTSLLETAQHGAKISLLGILPSGTSIDWDLVIFKMLTLKGIYGREVFSTWYKMVELVESGLDLHPIITHEFPAEEFQKGFDAMEQKSCGKVILNW